jgi:DNA-binding winged helix-turn-helix (wHTH) protein/TolB-like protein/Flp pilus assembly protein TadD
MNESRSQIYEFDEFRLDAGKRRLTKGNGENVALSPKVFDLLLYLVIHGGRVIEKDELMSAIWSDTIVEESNLSQNVSILRRVLGEKRGEHSFLATIPGTGYKFVCEVREIHSNSELSAKEIAEIKTEQANESHTSPEFAQRDIRLRVLVLSVVGLLGLGLLGLYLWREKTKPPTDFAIKTIAVLPFKSLVAEQRNEALELGMAETLIAKLAGGEEITVRPLSSVRKYTSPEQDSLLAGSELGVAAILEGTIQTWGDKIRISARLLRTGDGKQLWAGQFDEKLADLFTVQDSISEKVAGALQIPLASKGKKHSTENIEAYQLYMRGRFHVLKLSPPEIQKGIASFQQAIELDSNYALAYAGLADAYRTIAFVSGMPELRQKAKAAAQKAVEIDDTLAEGHAILGSILFWHDWDWTAAENQFKRGLELNPNSADTRFAYAHLLSNMGRHTEALAEAKRARELDPLNLRIVGLEALFLTHAGRTDEALAITQKVLEMDPNFWGGYNGTAMIYIEKRMFTEAIDAAQKAKTLSPGNSIALSLGGYASAKSGKQAEARAAIEELLKSRYIQPYTIALVYNGLDEPDKALEWLERGFQERDPGMTFLKVDSKWNNLRDDPRFIELMKRMNF